MVLWTRRISSTLPRIEATFSSCSQTRARVPRSISSDFSPKSLVRKWRSKGQVSNRGAMIVITAACKGSGTATNATSATREERSMCFGGENRATRERAAPGMASSRRSKSECIHAQRLPHGSVPGAIAALAAVQLPSTASMNKHLRELGARRSYPSHFASAASSRLAERFGALQV